MKFDNAQFEKNCQESMNTLDKLKAKISGSDSSNALSGLTKAANNVDLSGLAKSVEAISNRFSTMGIVGMTVISNLTSYVMSGIGKIASSIKGMIYGGGLTRALNIEQARFQITGLKKDWEALSEDIDYAVSGTAYGFDAAAKAAAQLSASGIEAGESMKKALRGISGVAAMSNAAYEEISPIFTAIAGQGKMMTQQLRQLELKGLNPSASMAEYFNAVMDGTTEASDSVKNYINELTGGAKVGEAAIREFVSDGKINFELFSEAMDSAFGEHAKDANKTFTGVLSNIKAAFARIGADFLTPIVTQESPIVLMLQKVREKVVEIKAALQPLVTVWTTLIEVVGKLGQRMVENFNINKIMIPFYNILHGVINIFQALFRVLSPIGAAIKEVFPKPFYVMVIELTDAFAKFTEHLKISDLHMTQLKIAFKGVFDIAKLLFDAIGTGLSVIFGMTDGMQGLSDTFFTTIANIGLFLSEIAETVRQSQTLRDVFDSIREGILNFVDSVSKAFSSMGGKDSSGFTKFANDLREATTPIQVFGAIFKGVFTTVYSIVSSLFPVMFALISKVGEVTKQAINDMVEAFRGGDATAATNLFSSGMLAAIIYWLKETISDIDGIVSKVKATLEGNVINILSSLKSTLLTYQKELRAETLLKIAEAIGILAISLVLLTGIDPEQMASAAAAIGVLLGAVTLVTSYLMKLQAPLAKSQSIGEAFTGFIDSFGSAISDSIRMSAMASALMSIAASVLILAVGVKMLGSMSVADLVKGTLAVTILLAEMAALAKFLTSVEGEITKGLTKFIAVAIAIDLLAIAVKKLGSMDLMSMIQGLGGVTALILEVALFAKFLDGADISKVAGKLIALAIGIDLLTIAVKTLGNMDLVDLGKGLLGVGALLAEIVIFSKLISPEKIAAVAGSLIPIAIAMDLLAVAVKSMGSLKLEDLAKGLGGVGVLLTELGLFVSLVRPEKVIATSAGVLILSVAIDTMAIAVKALGSMNLISLAKGLGAIGAMLVEIGVFTKVINPVKLIAVSAGLLVFSASLIPFSMGMAVLAALPLEGIFTALITLGVVLAGLAVLAPILTPLLPVMAALAGIFTLLGIAALATGVGISALSAALIALAGFGVAGVAALAATLGALAGLIPQIVSMITDLVAQLLQSFMTLIPLFAEAIVSIIDAILSTIATHLPSIMESGISIIVSILEGLASGITQITTAAGDLIVAFLTAIGVQIPRIVDAGFKLIISFIEGMAQSIRDNVTLMITAVNDLMESVMFAIGAWIGNFINGGADMTAALVEGIKSVGGPAEAFAEFCEDCIKSVKDKIKDIKEAAFNFVKGFIDGIKGKIDDVIDAAAELGDSAINALNGPDGIDAHSPSKKATASGEYVGAGFVKGMESKEDDAYNEGQILGQSGIEGLKDSGVLGFLDDVNSQLNGVLENNGLAEMAEEIKETKEAADTSTTSLDDYSKSVGKTGGASSKAAEEVKDLSDSFKTLEKGSRVDLGNMINNLANNNREIARWAQDMKLLMGKGFDSAITDWIKNMGVGGHETVKAFMNATTEEVGALNHMLKSNLTLEDDAKKYIEGDYEAFGTTIMQVLNDTMLAYDGQLAQTIQDAIDPFSEFDKKTELTGDQMLSNMRSQITGISEWSNNVTSLIGRVPESMIQYFQELGPASYEEVNAMAHMTEGQLAEAVELWNQQLELGKQLAIQQAQKYQEVGMAVSEGLTNGINFDKATEDGLKLGDNMITGTKTALDSHSPSQVYFGIGKDTVQGLINGINVTRHIPVNLVIMLAKDMIDEAMKTLNWAKGNEITTNLLTGMQHGIDSNGDGVIGSMRSLCNSIIDAAQSIFDEHSPSKVFERIGRYLDEGLVNGIDRSSGVVISSVETMADATIDQMASVVEQIAANLQNEFDGLAPVITPVMDLTELQNGKDYLNSMFGSPTYRLAHAVASDYASAGITAQTTVAPAGNADVVAAINGLRGDVNELTNQMSSMQVMLDGQTLVGELTPAIDSALGTNAMRAGRGN